MEWSDKRRSDRKELKTIFEQISFTEIKKLIDEGYERFWDAPHRKALKPKNANFGSLTFGKGKDFKEDIDYLDDLT